MAYNKYRLKGAFHYQWYETEDWYKWAVDRCVDFCQGKTIDMGCGDGLLVSKLKNGFGIDNDTEAIMLAKQKGLKVAQKSIYDVGGKWEYMACLNVIEHLTYPEALRTFIRNNVTKGAIIITIDYQGGNLGEDHKKEYTMDELAEFFEEFKPKTFRYKDTEWIGVEITK